MPATVPAPERPIQGLTFKDRLSRLNFTQAVRLLGQEGKALIREGGKFEIKIAEQVFVGGDLFRLSLPSAVATITTRPDVPQRLHWNCTACDSACPHVGAALSLILEEKTALGLAKPPKERVPVESLTEAELVEQALQEVEAKGGGSE